MIPSVAHAPTLDRRGWTVLVLVWLPLVVGYSVAISLMVQGPQRGIGVAIRTALLATVALAGVWWVTGRLQWPDRFDLRFYLAHVAGGVLYGTAWWAGTIAFDAMVSRAAVGPALVRGFTGPYAGWNIFLGLLVYGLTAGVSYAVRAQEAIRREQVRAAQADAWATGARLAALQAQLNPHFLFNTLHSLTALIQQDPGLAEEAVERLGELLRYALDHGARDDVLLRDEWEFVEHYLALEQIRLGERLRVVREVDATALAHRVPPFCLQPLVENALRHGIGPRPGGGTVRITLARSADAVLLRVADDGAGAARDAQLVGTGVGLDAVATRLAVWDGGGGTLGLETAPGQGFVATVTVPIVREGPALGGAEP